MMQLREIKKGQMYWYQRHGPAVPVMLIEPDGYDKLMISRGRKPLGVWMALFPNGKMYQVVESDLDIGKHF